MLAYTLFEFITQISSLLSLNLILHSLDRKVMKSIHFWPFGSHLIFTIWFNLILKTWLKLHNLWGTYKFQLYLIYNFFSHTFFLSFSFFFSSLSLSLFLSHFQIFCLKFNFLFPPLFYSPMPVFVILTAKG